MAKGTKEKMWRKALGLTAFLVFVGFGAVVVSLFRWQVLKGEELSNAALDQSLRSTTLSAMRGTIYDATGKVMAQSASVWTVVLEPAYFADYDDPEATRQKVAQGLASILEMDQEEVYEKTQGNSYFVYLKRRVETSIRDEINQFLEDNKISSGVRLIEDYKRYYPYGTVASTVLGFTGTDGQGLEGLELQYDSELRGTAGRLISAKNALGTDMPFEYEQYVEAEDGYNLVLTIDETVQSILEKYLAEGVDQFNVKNGAVAIAMDVDTGAILGMATTPTYDPNDPFTIYDEDLQAQIDALSGGEQDEAFNAAQLKQWRNKAVSDTYYPGSVFKMCTYAMGLEEGVVTEDSTFTCTGGIMVEGYPEPISCWKHTPGHGLETFREGLYNSCNPWAIHIGQLLGGETFAKYREAFGFTESTGIDLPGEAVTLYHNELDLINTPSDLAVESFGQNFSITPIHMITAAAAIANGGNLVTPHVVDRIVDQDGNIVETADTSYRRQVVSQETCDVIIDILRQNVEEGTATGGYVAGYRVCGKTGTSEKVAQHNEDPSKPMEYIASFCGFAPAEDPKYALLVFFDEPDDDTNGGYNGGNAVAGPYFAKMMEEILPYLGVEAQYSEEEYNNLDTVAPNVTDLTLEEAYEALEEAGLSYSVVGDESEGTVVTAQVPASGGAVPKDGKVVLYTNGYDEDSTLVEVPNFAGYDVANASYLAGISNLQISISGSSVDTAVVTSQSVQAGEKVPIGTVISLSFVDNTNAETGATAGVG